MNDVMTIEILEDGTIKTSTDKVSMPNHSSAENFLREVGRLADGETTRVRKTTASHSHGQTHGEHTHQH